MKQVSRSVAIVVAAAAILVTWIAVTEGKHRVTGALTRSSRAPTTLVLDQGRQNFRFDTFGDEAFWGDQLHLHEAIATLTPRKVLDLGLRSMRRHYHRRSCRPSCTGASTSTIHRYFRSPQENAVVGVAGFFADGTLRSFGIECAICHSTVDDSVAPGVGARLDGLANRELNVGAIELFARWRREGHRAERVSRGRR